MFVYFVQVTLAMVWRAQLIASEKRREMGGMLEETLGRRPC